LETTFAMSSDHTRMSVQCLYVPDMQLNYKGTKASFPSSS